MNETNLMPAPSRIIGWTSDGIHLETHCGTPPLHPPHAHDSYQIGFTTRDPGSYLSRGRTVPAPPGSIVLFHPGEIHETRGHSVRATAARLAFVPPPVLRRVAASVGGAADADLPFFPRRVIVDRRAIAHFLHMHRLFETAADALERESALLDFLVRLVGEYATTRHARQPGGEEARIKRVRDFIDSHYDDSLSLRQLAALACVSPFHLARAFRREVGLSPHAYQVQWRIEKAKAMLARGESVTEVALRTGFFDQSHLTRHFRRVVGVSPGSYARSL